MDAHALTQKLLSHINVFRAENKLEALKNDMEACAIATSWCAKLSRFEIRSPCFPNEPASERYYRGGVQGFSAELLGGVDQEENVKDMDQAWALVRKIYEDQISSSEIAGRLLAFPSTTHAGIGFHMNQGRARIAVAFVTKYGTVNPVKSSWSSKEGTFLSGRLISKNFTLSSLVLRADTSPRQAFTTNSPFQHDSIKEKTTKTSVLCRIETSDIRFDERGLKWTAPLNVEENTPPGHYVLEVYLQQDNNETFLADQIVLDHPQGLPCLKPVTGIWIVSDKKDEDTKESDKDLEPSSAVPPGSVWSTIGVAPKPEHKNLKFCFESGESSSLSRKVITDIQLVSGEEPQLNAPEGFSLIPINLMLSSESKSYAYLCTKSTDPRPRVEAITEIVLCWHRDVPTGFEALSLPSGGTLCYKKDTMNEEKVDEIEIDSKQEETSPSSTSSPAVDIQAMIERVSVLKMANTEYNTRLAKILHGREERKRLNDGLDTGDSQATSSTLGLDNDDDAALSYQIRKETENKKQYRQNLRHWASHLISLEESRHRANKKAMELQLRLDEKETKGTYSLGVCVCVCACIEIYARN